MSFSLKSHDIVLENDTSYKGDSILLPLLRPDLDQVLQLRLMKCGKNPRALTFNALEHSSEYENNENCDALHIDQEVKLKIIIALGKQRLLTVQGTKTYLTRKLLALLG